MANQLTLFAVAPAARAAAPANEGLSKTRKKQLRRKLQRKRAYLRDRLKHKYHIDTKARTIVLPCNRLEDLPVPDRYSARKLIETGFTHKLSLF